MDEKQSLDEIKQEFEMLISELRDIVVIIKKCGEEIRKELEKIKEFRVQIEKRKRPFEDEPLMGEKKDEAEKFNENKKEDNKITETEDIKMVEEFFSQKPLGPWPSTADIDI